MARRPVHRLQDFVEHDAMNGNLGQQPGMHIQEQPFLFVGTSQVIEQMQGSAEPVKRHQLILRCRNAEHGSRWNLQAMTARTQKSFFTQNFALGCQNRLKHARQLHAQRVNDHALAGIAREIELGPVLLNPGRNKGGQICPDPGKLCRINRRQSHDPPRLRATALAKARPSQGLDAHPARLANRSSIAEERITGSGQTGFQRDRGAWFSP